MFLTNPKEAEAVVREYVSSLGKADLEGVRRCLHPDVIYISVGRSLTGSAAMLKALTPHISWFSSTSIMSVQCREKDLRVIYKLDTRHKEIGSRTIAEILQVHDSLITSIFVPFVDLRMEVPSPLRRV